MTKALLTAPLALLILFSSAAPGAPQEPPSQRAERILREIDDMWRGKSSAGTVSMRVRTENYTRTLRMSVWSKGKEKSLVVIQSPLREKNTATLKSGSTIYSYLPKTDRTIRLTAGMMMGSWMGSHFTNDDLVKESRMSEDYDAEITFEGVRGGVEIIEITLSPKQDAPVVWGKILISARADDYIPIRSLYYDEDGNLSRTMTFSDVKTMGGRLFPANLKVVPAEKPSELTELVYEDMRFDLNLPDEFFSLASLRRR